MTSFLIYMNFHFNNKLFGCHFSNTTYTLRLFLSLYILIEQISKNLYQINT